MVEYNLIAGVYKIQYSIEIILILILRSLSVIFFSLGNGKRSWSPPVQEPEMNRKDDELGRTMLRNVLLKRLNTYPSMSSYYSDSESFYPMGSDFTEEGDSMSRENELRQLLKEQVNTDLNSSSYDSTFTKFILCS